MTRFTLDPDIERALKAIATAERRSLANTVSVLITEAIQARRAARDAG